jgi:predicted amidohydrolase
MAGMMEQAAKTVDFDLPTIVVFPETVGLWLSFVPEVYDQIRDCTTIRGALVRGIPRNFGRFAGACWRYRTIGVPTIFLETALDAEATYRETFSDLARQYGCFLQAGTIYIPPIEDEPVKGRHPIGRKVYTAYFFGPNGLCLQRVPKRIFCRRWSTGSVYTRPRTDAPIDTPLTPGHPHLLRRVSRVKVEHYDSLGVDIILIRRT